MDKEQWIADYVQNLLKDKDALAYYNMAVSEKGKEFADRMLYEYAEGFYKVFQEVDNKVLKRIMEMDTTDGKVKNRPMVDSFLKGIIR